MSTHSSIYTGTNTHMVQVLSLVDSDGNAQTDATVQLVSITDASGNVVSGLTFPIPLAHVSSGNYRAVIPTGGAFSANKKYTARITAVGSQGYRADWSETLVAKTRRG